MGSPKEAMRIVLLFIAILCAIFVAPLAQGTVLYRAAPGGVTVDLAFLLTVCAGLVFGSLAGLVYGLAAGLMVGTAAGNLAGPLGAVYALVGALAGLVRWTGVRSATAAAGTAGLLTLAMLALELALLRESESPRPALPPVGLLAAYHALLAVPMAGILSALGGRESARLP